MSSHRGDLCRRCRSVLHLPHLSCRCQGISLIFLENSDAGQGWTEMGDNHSQVLHQPESLLHFLSVNNSTHKNTFLYLLSTDVGAQCYQRLSGQMSSFSQRKGFQDRKGKWKGEWHSKNKVTWKDKVTRAAWVTIWEILTSQYTTKPTLLLL